MAREGGVEIDFLVPGTLEYKRVVAKRQWARAQQRRLDWIESQGGCCRECGGTSQLQVDHIDPRTKDPELKNKRGYRLWRWRETRRQAELAKCQVLCFPCHIRKTNADRGGGAMTWRRDELRAAQLRALWRIAHGATLDETALAEHISLRTVNRQLAALRKELGVPTTFAAIIALTEELRGMSGPPDWGRSDN